MPSHHFTPENARLFSAKGRIARAANKAAKCKADLTLSAQPIPPVSIPDNYIKPELSHQETRLIRVRSQLDMIDSLIAKERLPQNLDRLAAASAKLAEQERVLSDRPLPGSRRPPNPRRSRLGSAVDTVPE